ncbi:hypothetical protein Bbelb_263500 [Branchiostoma belcheri]|nr:hypothetical protein Bbelb_263500 [Branchiostoma belcheri]
MAGSAAPSSFSAPEKELGAADPAILILPAPRLLSRKEKKKLKKSPSKTFVFEPSLLSSYSISEATWTACLPAFPPPQPVAGVTCSICHESRPLMRPAWANSFLNTLGTPALPQHLPAQLEFIS